MASKVLRCFLLIFFIFAYCRSVFWYQQVSIIKSQHVCSRPDVDVHGQFCDSQSNNSKSCLVYAVRGNDSESCLEENAYFNVSGCSSVLPKKEKLLASSPSVNVLVILKSDLLKVSSMVINALTILDIVLSRRTKPWRFLLRILYRVGRSNLKWGLLWAVFQLWSHFEGNWSSDIIEVDVEQLPFSPIVHQMQQIWIALQSYPVLLVVTFFIYNLAVSWIVHRLNHRNRNHNTMTVNSTLDHHTNIHLTNGPRNVRRRILSRWSLLIDCFFRPLSFDTASNLMDFELDENVEQLIERLALPNLWLTPTVPTDYLNYLPVWRFDCWSQTPEDPVGTESQTFTSAMSSNYSESIPVDNRCSLSNFLWNDNQPPPNMKWISSADCAICLDRYRFTVDVCGLPCGHQFHHNCIMVWLQRDNHHCPICRWPAYQNKYLSI
ncbi:E3 ubiquitin-protein ligase RNF103 isoform X2 [Daphnia magna]|uniref:E3 ubiquitin-protein ligase RNF103 isoform X2 n=1 Tax=Daphnia magna TaxID=35525 RepID=UPI001E1BA326|nr:E3 ubiquitin-protein ligase RNF103 isoform X2 [Daphnia magna]